MSSYYLDVSATRGQVCKYETSCLLKEHSRDLVLHYHEVGRLARGRLKKKSGQQQRLEYPYCQSLVWVRLQKQLNPTFQ